MSFLKKYLLPVMCFAYFTANAQMNGINITNLSIKPQMPGDISTWTTLPGGLYMTAQATTQMHMWPATLVVQIKQGGSTICGNTRQNGIQVDSFTVRNFSVNELTGALLQCPVLKPGSYSICTQFFGHSQGNEQVSREVCKEFIVADVAEFCSPPQNVGPQDEKIFTEKDFLTPKIFTWTPFISSSRTTVTYRLTVWEVEDGQSPAQAMYDNLPVLQQEVRGQTRYVSSPGTWERRTATYIWREEAIDQEGNLLCKTAASTPTIFKIIIADPPPPKQKEDSVKNTPCGNGDFESGTLDPVEWSGGYTGLAGDNSTFSPPFNTTILPANGNPVDAPLGAGCGGSQSGQNHHVIVSAGFDPSVPTLRRTPLMSSPNNYALRLGNNCNGCGTERIRKTFTVPAANATYKFMYALVFEAPHDIAHNPSLWVRVFNAGGTAIPGLVYLDPLSPAPMDRAVSDLTNPYWQSHGAILYRDWACAKIDLSSLVGQTVTIELLTNDCAFCGHYGYGYFDNFCLGCDAVKPPDSCCSDTIKILSNTVTTTPANMLNVVQNFNLSPGNITKISAEIAFVNESVSDTSCRKCAVNENAVWNFMPMNKAVWNSSIGINGSPVNASGTYPAQQVVWFCNQQGNLKLDLKIALPGIVASAACKRTGKVGIRFTFTDKDCKTCEKYVIYNYTVN